MRVTLTWMVGVLFCGVFGLGAQEPIPLGPPSSRAAEGLTWIFAVGELWDGRVVVTDAREPAVLLVDFEDGGVRRIGRQGQGPEEFLGAFSLVRRPDGGFGVYDARQVRLFLVSAEGGVLGTERFERPSTRGLAPPRGTTPEGEGVIALRSLDGDRGLRRESVVYRWNLETGDADSLGIVMNYAVGQEGRGVVPMPRGDAWTALEDGSWARIVADDYRVEWHAPDGTVTSGDPIPHRTRPPTRSEQDAWVRQMLSRSGGTAAVVGDGGSRVSDARVRSARIDLDEDRFPERAPLFEPDFVPASPRGEIWLKRTDQSTLERTVFDVIDRSGRRVARRSVEGRARVAGFGEGTLYLVRIDEFDLEWLERYDPRG